MSRPHQSLYKKPNRTRLLVGEYYTISMPKIQQKEILMDKELLIGQLTIDLADSCTISTSELKEKIANLLANYNVSKIETTLPSTGDGSATRYIFEQFAKSKINQGMNQKTLKQYSTCLSQLVKFCNKEMTLIDYRDINDFFRNCRERGLNPNSIHNKYRLLSSIYNYAQDYGYISMNPMHRADKIKVKPVIKKVLSQREEELIKANIESISDKKLRKRDLAIFYFLLDSGVRVSELCDIRLSDIDFSTRTVIIRHGKGDKQREVFYGERTEVRLKEYFATRPDMQGLITSTIAPLFTSIKGDKQVSLNPRSVELRLKKIGRDAGVPRLHPHLLRATFATNMVEKGMPIKVVADLLGHSNLNTIHKYVLFSQKKKKEYFEKYV